MKNFAAFSILVISLQGQIVVAGAPPGQVVAWGFNYSGQVTGSPTDNGIRAPNNSTGIVAIAGRLLDDAVAIAAGGDHSLALRRDGTVVAWGWNHLGTVFREGTNELIRIGDRTLHSPVTIEEQGSVTNGPVTIGGRLLSNVTAIAAGTGYSLAVQGNGTVVGWGRGPRERQLDGVLPVSNVVAIAAGPGCENALSLLRDRTVVNCLTGIPLPNGFSNVVAISANGGHDFPDLALRGDSTVTLLTDAAMPPQMCPPANLSNVVAIASGYSHYLALKRDGTVFGWGENTNGEVTGTPSPVAAAGLAAPGGTVLSNVVAISASQGFSVALKSDGKVVAWGQNARGQTDVPNGLSGVVAIATGVQHCLAISTNTSGLKISMGQTNTIR